MPEILGYEVYTINAGMTLAYVPCRLSANEVKPLERLVKELGKGNRAKVKREDSDALVEAWKKYRSGE